MDAYSDGPISWHLAQVDIIKQLIWLLDALSSELFSGLFIAKSLIRVAFCFSDKFLFLIASTNGNLNF